MMFCNFYRGNKYNTVLLAVGVVSLVFGLVGHFSGLYETGKEAMLMGMFTGIGFAFIAVSAIILIRKKLMPAEKKKQEDIMLKDERNIMILNKAYTHIERGGGAYAGGHGLFVRRSWLHGRLLHLRRGARSAGA
jgi:hypothetical protein